MSTLFKANKFDLINIGWAHLTVGTLRLKPKISGRRVAPTNHFSCHKTRVNDLSCGIRMRAQISFVLSQITPLTDGQTDMGGHPAPYDRRLFHSQLNFRPNYPNTRLWPSLPIVVHTELILDETRSVSCQFVQMASCIVGQVPVRGTSATDDERHPLIRFLLLLLMMFL